MSSLKDSIDIAPTEKKTLLRLLKYYLPNTEIWAYGSRVKWTSRPASDLDLVAFASPEQKAAISKLREALETSSLPFRVDLFIWDAVPETFRESIKEKHLVLQEPEKEEVGQIRDTEERMNWVNSTVGEFCPFAYGKSLPEKNREEGSIPVYGSNGIVGFHNSAYIANSGVIIGRKGSVGFIHFSEQDFWPIDTTFFVDKGTVSENRFCYYLLSTLGLKSMNFDAAVPGLNRDNAHALEIRIPDSEKDRKDLVEPLKTLDDKIALNRKLNETLEGMARALFQSWFVDFDPVKAKLAAVRHGCDPEKACMAALSGKLRIPPGKPKYLGTPTSPSASSNTNADEDVGAPSQLPTAEELDAAIATLNTLSETQRSKLAQTATHFPATFQESELGLIPEGWGSVALYDTADFVNGAAFKSNDFTDDKNAFPIIKIAELKQGISDQTKYTKKDVKDRHRINKGDLVYSWSGSPSTSFEVFKWFGSEGWLNQHIFKINTTSREQTVLVWLILKYLKPELIRIAKNKQTTGLGHVTVADMKRLFVVWPDDKIMKVFGSLAIPIYEKHSAHIMESNTLAQLRDTLLPRLLSGELSVKKAKETVEAAVES